MASHIATHDQFPSVHRDQVADKPLKLCPCLTDTTRCRADNWCLNLAPKYEYSTASYSTPPLSTGTHTDLHLRWFPPGLCS